MMTRRCIVLLSGALMLAAGGAVFAQAVGLPPAEADSLARLQSSPRHGEWVTVDAGGGDKVDLWVVYPERSDKAPVVIVIHEIYGLTDWVRSVADQLAAEGFIAIAPDLLTGKAPGGKGSSAVTANDASRLIAGLQPAEITGRLDAAVRYGTSLPAATRQFGVVGYCWGGGTSFTYATQQPGLGASVVFYGTPPATDSLSRITAPVLAFYGGSDARVTSTAAPTDAEMKRLGKKFDYEVFAGAGHAFLRQQTGQNGANMTAAQKSWPRMVDFLKQNLETRVSFMDFSAQTVSVSSSAVSSYPVCTCVDDDPAEAHEL